LHVRSAQKAERRAMTTAEAPSRVEEAPVNVPIPQLFYFAVLRAAGKFKTALVAAVS